MRHGIALAGLLIALGSSATLAQNREQKAPQLAPNRLSSIGDSMTRATDAELPFSNHWASWANGYRNFWTWFFGLTDVNSHNQRITRNFGSHGRRNFIAAHNGHDSRDFAGQAATSVSNQATYVTVLLGHNDVCAESYDRIPTDGEFEANMRAGFEVLRDGLPDGATVQVVGMVDVVQLHELGGDLTAWGFLDCRVLWATTLLDLFPCGTVLSPANSEADRAYARSRNQAFNGILEELTREFQVRDSHHHYHYTAAASEYRFSPGDVSWLDCFHPSARGQRKLAEQTWSTGAFAEFDR